MDNVTRTHVECHQVLHGYSDGHQLLASSLTLPRAARTRMLFLTDLSGPSIVKGFESYLTGYPLRFEGLYAFSRTWYAEEMPRPGCVWTHTLLLSNAALATLPDLSSLIHLFSRPAKKDIDEHFVAYKAYVARDIEPMNPLAFGGFENQIRSLVEALYELPTATIVMGARNALDPELSVLAIWSQQWPRLRQSFSFCTGSLGRRSSGDVRFDLQVVPDGHIRQFRRAANSDAVIAGEKLLDNEKGKDWVNATLNDLVSSNHKELRQFMWEFGQEHEEGRTVFASLNRIYLLAYRDQIDRDIPRKLLHCLRTFPRTEDASRLKNSLFGYPRGSIGGEKRPVEEQFAVAELLLSHDWNDCISLEIRNPRGRGQGLGNADCDRAISLADSLLEIDNSVAEEFLQGLAEVLEPEDVLRLPIRELFLSRIVAAQPRFAAHPLAWQQSHDRQMAIIQGLTADGLASRELVMAVSKAALTAGSDTIAGVKSLNETAKAEAFLEWLADRADQHAEIMACRWKGVLIGHDDLILKWLTTHPKPSPPVILASALALAPSVDVSALDILIWSRLPGLSESSIDVHDIGRATCFALRKALEASAPEAANVVRHVFGWTYYAAERGTLPEESWDIVSTVLPGSWWEWDKCDRLIRGVTDKFAACHWSIEHLLQTFKQPNQLESAIRYIRWNWKEYLSMVCDAFHRNELAGTRDQVEVLRQACSKSSRNY
jgi:hypothetical protein